MRPQSITADPLQRILIELTQLRHQVSELHQSAALQLLTVDEVAHLLRCSPKHIYEMVKAGAFPSQIKIGNASRWRQRDIEAWMAQCP